MKHILQVTAVAGLTGIAMLSAISCGRAGTYPDVTIKDCSDGDTCTTKAGEKIKLACIETPELMGENARPAPAMAAKYHLNGMLMNQKVGIRRITTDRHGRTVAELYLNGSNVQQEMVASGHAVVRPVCLK